MTKRIVNRIVNLLPVGLLLYGLGIAFWPMLRSGFALMQVDPADTRHLNYVLEYAHRWLAGDAASVWSPPFFFPQAHVSAFTELMLGVAPFYSAWRALGIAPDTSFQLWMLTVAALNFLAAWLLFKGALNFEPLAAGAGAFLVSFGNVRLAELNHQHLLPHFFTFTALHALVRLLTRAPRPAFWLFAFFASLVLQLYAALTLGWFLCFALGLALLWSLAVPAARAALLSTAASHWRGLALGAAGSALALWPLLGPYLAAAKALGPRSWGETAGYLPQLHSWFYLGPHNWLMGWMAEVPPFADSARLGLGFATTAVTVYALWKWRERPGLRVLALTALTLVLLVTLYRGKVSPWQVVAAVVPGAGGMRAVGRIGLLLLIPAGIAVATFIQRAPRRWLALAAGAFCLLEQGARVPDTYDKAGARADAAKVATLVPRDCRAFFYAPVGEPKYDEKTQLDAMWASLETGIPTANGYSSHFPPGWGLLEHGLAPGVDAAPLQAELARWEERWGLAPATICFVRGQK